MGKSRKYRILNKRLVQGDSNLIDDDHEIKVIENTSTNTVDLVNSKGESYVSEKKTDESEEGLIYSDFYLAYITPYSAWSANEDQNFNRFATFHPIRKGNDSCEYYENAYSFGHVSINKGTPPVIKYSIASTDFDAMYYKDDSISEGSISPKLILTRQEIPTYFGPDGLQFTNYYGAPTTKIFAYLHETFSGPIESDTCVGIYSESLALGSSGSDRSILLTSPLTIEGNPDSSYWDYVSPYFSLGYREIIIDQFVVNRTVNGSFDPILIVITRV